MNIADLVSYNSHYHHFMSDNTEMVDLNSVVMFVISEPIDYDNFTNRDEILNVLTKVQSLEHMSKIFSLNWLSQYDEDELINYKDDPSELLENLDYFPPFKNDIVITQTEQSMNSDQAEYQITASRFYLQFSELHFNSKDALLMNQIRKLCDESYLPIIAYSIGFRYFEQFGATIPNIVRAIIVSTIVMFLISIIFIPDLVSVFCILFSMGSIIIGKQLFTNITTLKF